MFSVHGQTSIKREEKDSAAQSYLHHDALCAADQDSEPGSKWWWCMMSSSVASWLETMEQCWKQQSEAQGRQVDPSSGKNLTHRALPTKLSLCLQSVFNCSKCPMSAFCIHHVTPGICTLPIGGLWPNQHECRPQGDRLCFDQKKRSKSLVLSKINVEAKSHSVPLGSDCGGEQ